MAYNSKDLLVGGYETEIRNGIISVALFPESDLGLNLPEGANTIRLVERYSESYKGSLELVKSSSIDIASDDKDNMVFSASIELGPDMRTEQGKFTPDIKLFNSLNQKKPDKDLVVGVSRGGNGDTVLILFRDNIQIGNIRYKKSGEGGSFNIYMPLTPGYEYDDIVLGTNLWAATHLAIADEYDESIKSQAPAWTKTYVGQTSYGTASNTQIAMLGAIGKYNLDLPEDERLRFDPEIIGAHLARTEDVLPEINYAELVIIILEAKIKQSDASPISHGEIFSALTQQFNTHRE